MRSFVAVSQWVVLVYFVGLYGGYLLLNIVSLLTMLKLSGRGELDGRKVAMPGLESPITVIVPAYNEESTIVATVEALLQLTYGNFEVVVVNDGSKDGTLDVLRARFGLELWPEPYRAALATEPVRALYTSPDQPKLRVLDKENGGKADALNAGINVARFPLFCCIDADSILQRDSLERVVQPFVHDPTTIAVGGTIRIANGCDVDQGLVTRTGLPRRVLPLIQVVEYLRAFLFGRLGWSSANAVLVISGAFGLFRKDVVIEAGGYRRDTIGEDMELIVRLHRLMTAERRPYRVVFLPDPICWTESPENLRVLGRQRIRWQRGLADSLWVNRKLMFSRKSGVAGWLAFPFFLVFECLGPLFEAAAYTFVVTAWLGGLLSTEAMGAFLLLAVGLGMLLSVSAILLEQISFHVYSRGSQLAALLFAAVIENLGYRQLVSFWRLKGMLKWLRRTPASWGEMTRRGTAPVAARATAARSAVVAESRS